LLNDLDAHDALVMRCARGQLTWAQFERAYDNFYPRYPLDGHGGPLLRSKTMTVVLCPDPE